MEVRRIHAEELTSRHLAVWSDLQRTHAHLASPFFRPEFIQAVSAARGDVYVGVIQEGGRPVGFFPFQLEAPSIAGPVGDTMNDCHGVIAEPGLRFDVKTLLRSCELAIWDFHSVPRAQEPFEPFHRTALESPLLDLSGGYAAYLADKKGSTITTLMRKARKIEREVGPLRFSADVEDEATLRRLMQWKSQQYERTGAQDLFAAGWPRRAVAWIFANRCDAFAGMLSVLHAGDQVVAMHFGIRSSRVWHWWFPVYDPRYAAYSPGLLLLLKMAESAESLGLDTIDLGCNENRISYKHRLMNGSVPLWAGSVELSSRQTAARRLRKAYRRRFAQMEQALLAVGRRSLPASMRRRLWPLWEALSDGSRSRE